MDEAWVRWSGWAAGILLMLGAVGAFFTSYGAVSRAFSQAERLVLMDEVYREEAVRKMTLPSGGTDACTLVPVWIGRGVNEEMVGQEDVSVLKGKWPGTALVREWHIRQEASSPYPLLLNGRNIESMPLQDLHAGSWYQVQVTISREGKMLATDCLEME